MRCPAVSRSQRDGIAGRCDGELLVPPDQAAGAGQSVGREPSGGACPREAARARLSAVITKIASSAGNSTHTDCTAGGQAAAGQLMGPSYWLLSM
jgi:hypothetical protein